LRARTNRSSIGEDWQSIVAWCMQISIGKPISRSYFLAPSKSNVYENTRTLNYSADEFRKFRQRALNADSMRRHILPILLFTISDLNLLNRFIDWRKLTDHRRLSRKSSSRSVFLDAIKFSLHEALRSVWNQVFLKIERELDVCDNLKKRI